MVTLGDRRATLDKLIPAIKHLEPEVRTEAVARVVEYCDALLPEDLMLTSSQLHSLMKLGMGIGAHTVSHPILASTESAVARREIADSRSHLEDILGTPITLFAYPNGRADTDYRKEHVEMVRDLGFEAAVSTNWGVNDTHSDLFQLARFTAWDQSNFRFGLRMLGNLRNRCPNRT
jgi:peptidoglycan/xylan/chitin deacetylase (PgdA/CDA1 family)